MDFLSIKRRATLLLIGSHVLCVSWIIILYFLGGFAFEDLTTAIALLVPLFAGFTTMIVRDAVAQASPEARPEQNRQMPWAFRFLTLTFTAGFSVYLFVIVTLKGFNLGFRTFEEFKILLGVSETVFGVYVGILLPTLFTHGAEKKQLAGTTTGNPTGTPRPGGAQAET